MSSQSSTLPLDPNSSSFPSRKDLPKIPGAPDGAAWVWGSSDNLGRLNLLTPSRILSAAQLITSGLVVPLNLPLNVPATPAFGRQSFKHTIKALTPGLAYDDLYELNTQSGSQWDGFRHCAHFASGEFYNGITVADIVGSSANERIGMGHWAERGIVGRGVLIDYWGYAQKNGVEYDPFEHHAISWEELQKCGESQGVDIRPASEGGDIQMGDLLFIRSGWCAAYGGKSVQEREEAALRVHVLGPEDKQRWAGVKQEEAMIDWLHDCWFAAVAGDAPSFEAWPSQEGYFLHEYLLPLWGCPIGEMWDLERLAETCREKGRWTFFVSSQPANVPGGVGSHPNAMAIF